MGSPLRPRPPPPSRTKWTRLVHPSVLIGHVWSEAGGLSSAAAPLLWLKYQAHPADSAVDARLVIRLDRLLVVYNPAWVQLPPDQTMLRPKTRRNPKTRPKTRLHGAVRVLAAAQGAGRSAQGARRALVPETPNRLGRGAGGARRQIAELRRFLDVGESPMLEALKRTVPARPGPRKHGARAAPRRQRAQLPVTRAPCAACRGGRDVLPRRASC